MRQTTRAARLQRSEDPFWDLIAVARKLQARGGCPWDRAQTPESLLPHLIEETWEVHEAVRRRRWAHLQEELGDVLYTTLFLSMLLERRRRGSLRVLLTATREKMVRRHPHVFGRRRAATPAQAYRHWQASKRQERPSGPSPSKALRRLLVAWWDWLLEHPEAHDGTRRMPPPSGRSRPSRARRARPLSR